MPTYRLSKQGVERVPSKASVSRSDYRRWFGFEHDPLETLQTVDLIERIELQPKIQGLLNQLMSGPA
jgi:hypothetical protein